MVLWFIKQEFGQQRTEMWLYLSTAAHLDLCSCWFWWSFGAWGGFYVFCIWGWLITAHLLCLSAVPLALVESFVFRLPEISTIVPKSGCVIFSLTSGASWAAKHWIPSSNSCVLVWSWDLLSTSRGFKPRANLFHWVSQSQSWVPWCIALIFFWLFAVGVWNRDLPSADAQQCCIYVFTCRSHSSFSWQILRKQFLAR